MNDQVFLILVSSALSSFITGLGVVLSMRVELKVLQARIDIQFSEFEKRFVSFREYNK